MVGITCCCESIAGARSRSGEIRKVSTMRPVIVAFVLVSFSVTACDSEWSPTLDDVLRLNHIQVKGTHNSYKLIPHELYDDEVPDDFNYGHAELDVQLAEQGVRQLELDLFYDYERDCHNVLHAPVVDPLSTCDEFTECLEIIRRFSDEHPLHLPIFVFIETKNSHFTPDEADFQLEAVERAITEVFPKEQLITPDEVRGDYDSLYEAVTERGWPTLGKVRGRIMLVHLDGSAYRDEYTEGQTTTEGRLMFPLASADTPVLAISKIDNPIRNQERIQEWVQKGLIVRTRSDTPGNEALTGDTTRREAAIESGAQIISTDYPVPLPDVDFVMEFEGIPHDQPGRCNPLTAPPECYDEALDPYRADSD